VARKVAFLEERTKKSTTEVVLDSIAHYYDALNDDDARTPAADVLEREGFIGCAKGPVDLSASYKTHLARAIEKKT